MIVVDLKPLLFVFVLALLGSALLAIWIDRRTRQSTSIQAERRFPDIHHAFAAAPFGVILFDARFACVYANPYARQLLSLEEPLASLPGHSWSDLLKEDLTAAQQGDIASSHYREVTVRPDLHVRWWIHPLGDQSLMFVMDISSQRRSEQTYQAFLTDLSHEIRTPLTAILTHLEVLRAPDMPEAIRDQSLSLIYRETNRIVRLTRDLLELGRLEMASEIAHRPIDIVVLAEEAISQIIPQAEQRQIVLSLQADAAVPRVLGDPDRLKQVFLNLLDNAVKYCRPGDQVEICLYIEPGGMGCTIRDTGPGIPPQHLPHVTRRLYRVNTDVEGSGLGLTLVEEILRRHQSRLDIHSQHEGEQTGTVLHFILPTLPVEKVV